MQLKHFLTTLMMASLPLVGHAQVEPTIELKSEAALLTLIDSHAKIKDINEVHVHLKRLMSIMEENKEVVNRLVKNLKLTKSTTTISTAFDYIKDYCLGIKTKDSVRVYWILKSLPQDNPDVILIEHLRQAVIKSAELFGLTPTEYVIAGKF